jgi:hydroxypyruvate isomerase
VIQGLSANLNTLYGEVEEVDRCAAAAGDGFRCVEMWTAPTDAAERVTHELERLNLSLASVNTHPGSESSDFGLAGDPARTDLWRVDFLRTLEFARHAHARAINVLVGGRRPGATRLEQKQCLLENLTWALTLLRSDDPALLLEPLNAVDRGSPLLRDVADAMSVISKTGSPPNLLLLFDVYHLFQEEIDPITTVRRVAGRIGHVQLADYPGRAEPGTGRIPIADFLRELAQVGYSSWLGLEYFPTDGEKSPFSWLSVYPEIDDRSSSSVVS